MPDAALGIDGLGHATEIGAGASAIVYKAIQVDLGREVAVKVLSANDDAFVRRFRREARTLGKLSLNPGIVTVHGTGVTESGQPYLILELCESSVHDHLKTKGRFDPKAACRVGAEVADAVSDAHKNGVVHRDIKPANLLRSQNGRYLITDFGISTVRDSTLGQTESIGFTVGYAAPETLRGEETSTAADVYALGATLFHMLSGHPPFVDRDGNSNLMAFAQRVINDPTPDLRPIGVPDDVARVVEGAMAKRPADRPSAAQLSDQLLAIDGDTMPDATPVSQIEMPAIAPQTQAMGATIGQSRSDKTVAMPRAAPGGAAVPPGRANYPLPPHSDDENRWKIVLLGALTASVVLLAGLAFVITQSTDDGVEAGDAIPAVAPRLDEVPDVTGQTENEATRQLTARGFEVRVEERTSDDEPAGSVLMQDPLGGGEAATGSTVTIFIAATGDVVLVDVPMVVGLTQAEAEAELRDIGLTVADPSLEFSEMPEGQVIDSVPAEGSSVDSTSSISLTISKGREPPTCSSLVGLPEAAAIDLIEAADLTASSVKEEDDGEPDGRVTACKATESQFDLTISDGPEICRVVTGLALAEGTAALEGKNYTVTATAELRPDLEAGKIFECTKEQSTASITYAEGLPSACPAAVIGATTTDARSALETAGFSDITVVRAESDTVASGRVIDCAVSGAAVTVTVSTGPAVRTGKLTVTLESIIVESACAGDGLRPDLFGSLAFAYDGEAKNIWTDQLPSEARTPANNGELALSIDRSWPGVPIGGELIVAWDLQDADQEGRAGDEDGVNDNVSATTKKLDLTGESRTWRPTSDANDDCPIHLEVSVSWSGLDN